MTLDGFAEGEYQSFSGSTNACVWQPSTGALGYVSHAPMGLGQVVVEEINEMDSLISGTFQFFGEEPSSGNTVEVAEGVFTDVKYSVETVTIGDNSLNVKIDGTDWEAVSVTGFVNGSKLTINATSADVSRTVGLTIPDDTPVGSYDIDSPFSSEYGGQYNADAQTFLTSDSGTLNISNHDLLNKVIEGTFSFEASEFVGSASASLTEGSFYVAY